MRNLLKHILTRYFHWLIFNLFFLININSLIAQTVIIDPTGDGGFETGTTFAANNWSATTSGTATQNQFVCNTGATTGFSGARCAYVSNNTAGSPPPHLYSTGTSRVTHIYRDITIPACATNINLNFNWIGNGEGTAADRMRVWIVPTSYTPIFGTQITISGTAPTGNVQVGLANYNLQSTWVNATTITLPVAYAGTTVRLVFEWRNDGSTGTQPPIAIDNISLTYTPPATMVYSSSTITQSNTTSVGPGATGQEIIGIQIATTGCSSPLTASSFTFSTNGSTTAANIANAKLWTTGTASTFATTTQLGSATVSPSGSFTITGGTNMPYTLSTGTNYFWLTYDIIASPTLGDVVDAECNSITVTTAHTPTTQAPAGNRTIAISYCTPAMTSISASGDYIGNFTFAGINNTTGDAATDYTYYSTLTASVIAGTGNPVSLMAGGSSSLYEQQFGIWVDYNHNGVFTDAGEFVFATTTATYSPTTATGTINIPAISASVLAGTTRLRVGSRYSNAVTSTNSCLGGSSYGEYEDYNINITAPVVCSGTPTAGNATASSTSVCSGLTSNLSLTGNAVESGLTYQWQSSPDNVTWADISGATSLTYVITVTSSDYYRCNVRCTSSGITSSSGSVLVNSVSCVNMDDTPVTTCLANFYDSGGPSADYSNNESFTKTFTTASASDIFQVTFSSFTTESSYDYLYIYDGPSISSPQIAGSPFSGSSLPPTITSSGNNLTFKFTSDGSTVYAGWAATITCLTVSVPNCATLNTPANGATTVCPGTGATLTWTPSATGFVPTGYQLFFGTNNPPTNIINGTNIGNVTTYTTQPLAANTTYYWRIFPENPVGANSTCTTTYSFTTLNVSITSTNSPVTSCQNTASLTATGSGTINWYNVATGGTPLGTGSPYTASFNGNTAFYAGATSGACESTRTPVNVVHTASPITITPSGPTTFLQGNSVGLTASSLAGYTYSWSPATGLNTTTGATVTATPATSTTYTVTGTGGGCSYSQTIIITVTLPCTGLGTGVTTISSLPFTDNGQTTCGDVDDITSANAIVGGSSSYYTGEDYVYIFTPSISGNVSINLTSSGTWTGLMLYQGCPMNGQGGTCIAFQQSSSGSKSMCVSVSSGVSYYLILDSYASPTCNPYDISISAPDPSGTPNDLPCNATTLALGGIEQGDNTCATGSGEPGTPSCWTNGNINTLWYKVVVPASGKLKIRTLTGTLTNTQIAVYQGNCSSLSLVSNACNDDVYVCGSYNDYSELTLTGLTSGATYYIAVDGYSSLTGSFSIMAIDGSVDWAGVPQQDCSTATVLCNSTTIVDNPGFVGNGNICDIPTYYSCLEDGELNSAWYQINIANAGDFIFTITPNNATTDYDWGLWNITSNMSGACALIQNDDVSLLIRCNTSAWEGATGLNTTSTSNNEGPGYTTSQWCQKVSATAGDVYLLHIQNWTSDNSGFNLDLTSSGSNVVNYAYPTSVTWTGAVNSDWFTAANWGGCVIPTSTVNAIIVNGPANQPIISQAGAICKNIQIINGANLTINSGLSLEVYGDFSNLGTLNLNATSTVIMKNGSVAQSLNGMLTGTNKFGNFTINKTGNYVTMNQDFEVGGNLTTSTNTSNLTAATQTLKVRGNINLTDGSNLSCPNVEFNGTSAQTFTNSSGTATFTNLTMNTSGGLTLTNTTASSIYINGVLTLTEGIIHTITSPNAELIMNAGSSATSGHILSYIDGPMQKIGNTAFTFPIGKSSKWARLGIASSTTLTNKFKAEYFKTGSANNSPAFMTGLDHVSYVEYWTIDKLVGSEYPAVTLYWEDAGTVVEKVAPYDSITDLSVAHWSGGKWNNMGGSGAGTWPSGQITSSAAFSSYSPISFGSKTGKNPLPVELLFFNGKSEENANVLNWATTSETNNSYFTLERSQNAETFEEIGLIKGSGNSNSIKNYQFIDYNPLKSINYYKLKQTDYDGNVKYPSNIIALEINHLSEYNIYPNPAKDELLISSTGKDLNIVKYIISDITGRKVLQQNSLLLKGNNQPSSIDIRDITEGIYFITISDYNNNIITQKKFVKVK